MNDSRRKLLDGFNAVDVENVVVKVPLPLAAIIAVIAVKRRIHSTITFMLKHVFFALKGESALLGAWER